MRLAGAALALVLVYIQPVMAQAPQTVSTGQASAEQTHLDKRSEAEMEAVEIVKVLQEGLLTIMKEGPEIGFEGRLETIRPVVEQAFDIPVLAAATIGLSTWRSWDDEQKKTFIATFEKFLTANYAAQFKSYSGQSFEILGTEAGPKSTILVKTQINRPNKAPVALTYLTRPRNGKIGIVDIFLAGNISEAARRRSEFGVIYGNSGFTGLMSSIERQVALLERGSAADSSKTFPDLNGDAPHAEL